MRPETRPPTGWQPVRLCSVRVPPFLRPAAGRGRPGSGLRVLASRDALVLLGKLSCFRVFSIESVQLE